MIEIRRGPMGGCIGLFPEANHLTEPTSKGEGRRANNERVN